MRLNWMMIVVLSVCILGPFKAAEALYPSNYLESRQHFRKMAEGIRRLVPNAELNRLVVEELDDFELTIDTLHLPAQTQRKKLVIITSGIHGIEANAGAALLFSFMEKLPIQDLPSTGFLLVHSVNPYGHAFRRRVSARNVDLNRHLGADLLLMKSQNEAYKKLEVFLNPQKALSAGLWQDLKLFAQSLWHLIKYGKKQMTQAVVAGQYHRADGIYFGGNSHEPQVALLRSEWQRMATGYKDVLHLDIHTGYGERGRLHFFADGRMADRPGFRELFAGYDLDFGEDQDFYTTSGSFAEFSIQTLPDHHVLPMTLEFGTLDSQTILGGFYSLRNMIYENQGHHHGFTDPKSQKRVSSLFREMFDPSDPQWRSAVLAQGQSVLLELSRRFDRLELKAATD